MAAAPDTADDGGRPALPMKASARRADDSGRALRADDGVTSPPSVLMASTWRRVAVAVATENPPRLDQGELYQHRLMRGWNGAPTPAGRPPRDSRATVT